MSALVERFRAVGGDLRIVATLRSSTWEVEYVREDLRDAYSAADYERAYRSIMGNQVSSDEFADVGGFGDVLCQQYFFEDIIVFQFPTGRYEGVFVSYDREDPFPVNEVVDAGAGVSSPD